MLELLDNIDLPEGADVTVTILDELSTRDREAFRRAAGGWKDVVTHGGAARLPQPGFIPLALMTAAAAGVVK